MRRSTLYLAGMILSASVAALVFWRSADRQGVHAGARRVAAGFCAAWAVAGVAALGRSRREARVVSATARAGGENWKKIAPDAIPKRSGELFVGWGVEWTWEIAQWVQDRLAAREIRRPADVIPAALQRAGAEPLFLSESVVGEHWRIHGSPGSGKTTKAALALVQLVGRPGYATLAVDPKSDRRLVNHLYSAAVGRNRPFWFFSPQMPSVSVAYNPFADFTDRRNIPDRIEPIFPSFRAGDAAAPFASVQWALVGAIVNACVEMGLTPSAALLEECAREEGRKRLFRRLVRFLYPDIRWSQGTGGKYAVGEYMGLLAKYDSGDAVPAGFVPNPAATRLAEILDNDQYRKMVTTLLPILVRLSEGVLGDLLSPPPGRPRFSWQQFERRSGAAYFYLSGLDSVTTGTALAQVAFLDLLNRTGRKLVQQEGDRPAQRTVAFVDEYGQVVMPELLTLLAMGRSAGVSTILASQSMADVAAKLGHHQAARVATNTRVTSQFAGGEEDATAFSRSVGVASLRGVRESQSFRPGLFTSGSIWVSDFDATFTRTEQENEFPLVPPWMIMALPTFHYFMRVGGRVWLGYAPLLEDPARDYLAERRALLVGRPPARGLSAETFR